MATKEKNEREKAKQRGLNTACMFLIIYDETTPTYREVIRQINKICNDYSDVVAGDLN